MWNKIFCNKIVQKKSHEKEKARLQDNLRNTKSSLRNTNYGRIMYRSSSLKRKEIRDQNVLNIQQENKKILDKLIRARKVRSQTVLSQQKINTSSFTKILQNNKKIIADIKKKSIQQENKRIYSKLISTSSSLKDIRIRMNKTNAFSKSRMNTVVVFSNDPAVTNPQKKNDRHIKTQQAIESEKIEENLQKSNITNKSLCQEIIQQTPKEQGIQQILDYN